MPGSPPWANLTDHVVREIANDLPCELDRVCLAAVCRSWRGSLHRLPPRRPPPKLPYLILPVCDGGGPVFSCILSSGAVQPSAIPVWACEGRYIGSYDGWVFLSIPQRDGPELHFLLNIYDFAHLELPNEIIVEQARSPGVLRRQPLSIIAATLSSQPLVEGCFVAAIISIGVVRPLQLGRPKLAVWRIFDPVIFVLDTQLEKCWEVEDVARHKGAFHFLTQREHIIVVGDAGFHGWDSMPPRVRLEFRRFSKQGRGYEQFVDARYLVESRGDLLMVVRCFAHPYETTSAFKVFRMAQPEARDGDDDVSQPQYIWRELPSLEGRMLFVGRGCSRSYDADQYP